MKHRTKRKLWLGGSIAFFSSLMLVLGFLAGRMSTPYCDISDVPEGEYTRQCFAQKDGHVLTLVQEDRSGRIRLVGFDRPLPASFKVYAGSVPAGWRRTEYRCTIYDVTGDEPEVFWSNHREDT